MTAVNYNGQVEFDKKFLSLWRTTKSGRGKRRLGSREDADERRHADEGHHPLAEAKLIVDDEEEAQKV